MCESRLLISKDSSILILDCFEFSGQFVFRLMRKSHTDASRGILLGKSCSGILLAFFFFFKEL